MRSRLLGCAAALSATVLLAGCATDGDGDGATTELTVLAAASLTDVFTEAGALFEDEHDGVTVRFSFAGSQELAAQINQGAPADALVTADTATMDAVRAETGDHGAPAVIARNALVIVTPPGNPADVTDLAGLGRDGLRLVLAAPEVPAGRYGEEILDRAGVTVTPVSQEPNVRAVLSKVRLAEADAGLVYATDAASAGDAVDTFPIPAGQNVVAEYPAAVLNSTAHPDEAAAFVAWLGTAPAQELLTDAGFAAP
ncbi:molybdate ABC transporter substrate-binding protein [Streptomyces carpaticus]|uniref:molybdate ABC transporter substrate-binding protein n=1 Tax=Streptomyces carpaticus TaxID=285558 RepID=UPI0031F9B2D0